MTGQGVMRDLVKEILKSAAIAAVAAFATAAANAAAEKLFNPKVTKTEDEV